MKNTPPRGELRVTVMNDDLFVLYENERQRYLDLDGEPIYIPNYYVFVLSTGKYLDGEVDWALAEEYPEFAPRWQREAVIARRRRAKVNLERLFATYRSS